MPHFIGVRQTIGLKHISEIRLGSAAVYRQTVIQNVSNVHAHAIVVAEDDRIVVGDLGQDLGHSLKHLGLLAQAEVKVRDPHEHRHDMWAELIGAGKTISRLFDLAGFQQCLAKIAPPIG